MSLQNGIGRVSGISLSKASVLHGSIPCEFLLGTGKKAFYLLVLCVCVVLVCCVCMRVCVLCMHARCCYSPSSSSSPFVRFV